MSQLDYKGIAARIKARRLELGYSYQDLAERTGMSKSTLQRYETGSIKNIPIARLTSLSAALQLSEESLIGKAPAPAFDVFSLPGIHRIGKGSMVPLYGRIACGAPILAVEELEEAVWMPETIHADFALTCVGDSMINARIFDGDIVFILAQPSVENGEIAAVIVRDEEVTLKRVYYYPEEDKMILRAENPTYKDQHYSGEELNHIKILGKATSLLAPIV